MTNVMNDDTSDARPTRMSHRLTADEFRARTNEELRALGVDEEEIAQRRAYFAELDAAIAAFEAGQPERPACPSWCALPAGHSYSFADYSDADDGVYIRWHSSMAEDGVGYVEQVETWDNGVLKVDASAIVCWVGGNRSEGELTATEARQAAAEFLAAAEVMDAIDKARG
jgi:hypothetical protein